MAHLYVFEMRFDLGTLDSGEQSLPFGLFVFVVVVVVVVVVFNMYDFKDQMKDTRIRHCFPLSIFLSFSLTRSLSVFFLTCKYGSHNSPLNTGSHEIYGRSRARAGLSVVRVYGPWEAHMKSPKCLGHMKQRGRSGLGVVRVYGPWEVRTKSPKYLGQMKLPSSSRAPYESKTREPVSYPTTCRTSLRDCSKSFRPVWAQ